MIDFPYTKSGILLVYKPVGVSSNKVVNIVKHCLGAKKCGHLGTLDLEGEGLLPITINNATKLFDWFLQKDKTYQTNFVFGFETDTLDCSGEIIKQKDCEITAEMIEKVLPSMTCKYAQMPPIYSAKKINGKTAYKEARKGNVLTLKPKEVEIYEIKLLSQIDKNIFRFSISCSSGTYIRSVCRDMAEKMSTYGSMQCILRTRCGGFLLDNAYTLPQIENGEYQIVSCEEVFDLPNIFLSISDANKLLNGQRLNIEKEEGQFKIFRGKEFMGIGEISNKILTFKLRLI